MKMKLKNLLAVLLVLLLCFSFTACQSEKPDNSQSNAYGAVNSDAVSSEEVPVDEYSPLLYKVTDDKGNTVWLFGSIHIGSEDMYPLPDYVMNAYNNADSIAVEADAIAFQNDLNMQVDALSQFVYKDGTTI